MTSKTTNKFSPEVRTRAVRMVLEHEGRGLALGGGCFDFIEDRLYAADIA